MKRSLNLKKWYGLLYISFLIISTAVVYFQVAENEFLENWDDGSQVVYNYDVKNPGFEIFASYYVGMYQPITTITYAIDYLISDLSPVWFHITNLIYHILVVIIVFYLFRIIFQNRHHAFIGALIFAVHPTHVESVAWLSARSNIIFTLFYLLTVISYLSYIRYNKKWKWYGLTLLMFLLSCFSKSAAVTLPLVLIALDYFYSRINWKGLLLKLPFFAISVVFGLVTIDARVKAEHITDLSDTYNMLEVLLITSYTVFRYFGLFVMPYNYSAFYTYPEKVNDQLPLEYYIIPIIFTLAMLVFIVLMFKKNKKALFGLVFFFLSISIMLKFIPAGLQSMADRYLYLPVIGLIIMVYYLTERFLYKVQYRYLIISFVVVVLVFFTYQTKVYSKYWKNEKVLFDQSLKIEPNAVPVKNFLGILKKNEGNYAEALQMFDEILEDYPQYGSIYNNRGNLYKDIGEFDKALYDYNMSLLYSKSKDHAQIYLNMGIVYASQQDYRLGLNYFNKSIELNDNYYLAYFNRGKIYAMTGYLEEALSDLNRCISLNTEFWNGYYTRGMIRYELNDINGACNDLSIAAEYDMKIAVEQKNRICN